MEDGVIINDSNTLNDKMTNWIAEHPNLITYLILEEALSYEDNIIPIQFIQKREEKHKRIINTLKEKYNSHISLLEPTKYNILNEKTNLPPYLNSQYSFIKYKIDKLRRKQFDQYSKNVAELLMFFGDDILTRKDPSDKSHQFIPSNVIFNFNINSFDRDSFIESNKIISLKYLAKSFEQSNAKISYNLNILAKNKNEQRKLILKILQNIAKINDEVLSFFPLNPHEYEFERILFSSFFPFERDFNNIVDNFQIYSPTETIPSILELCYKIIKYFNLPESPSDSILFLLFFRIIYDKLYLNEKLPFFQLKQGKSIDKNNNHSKAENGIDNNNNDNSNNENNDNDNIKNKENTNNNHPTNKNIKHSFFEFINSLTFTSIDPPENSSLQEDPLFATDHNIRDTISQDHRFLSAINSLVPIVFATNPLDALNCIRLCLLGVEKTASLCFEKKEIACLISFDRVFTIFLYVIAGSGLEELFQCYAPFIQSCIPERLLSLPFQFALTKISAAETHLRRIMYEKSSHQNKNNNNSDDLSNQ